MSHVVIQCGSSARGDINANSDIDIVCIWSGRSPDFENIKKNYGDVMFYTSETISRMRDKGGLFLTHLDIDGKYLSGDRGLLKLFDGFKPTAAQLQESLKESREFLRNLNWFPDSDKGYLWLCDVLYISLRNIIYCKNAQKNIYEFGYGSALKAYSLGSQDVEVMLGIREGKYSYRKGDMFISGVFNLGVLEDAVGKVVGVPIKIERGGVTDWERNWSFNYWDERIIERAIINNDANDVRYMNMLVRHNYNKVTLRSEAKKIVAFQLGKRFGAV